MTEQPSLPSVPLADALDRFIRKIGTLFAWAYLLLILVIMTQVILRKGFSHGLIALEELEWHLYGTAVMVGLAYAQINNAHVRVDIFHANFSQRTKHWVEILGILCLVLPFITIIFLHSLEFVADSWRINESSSAPSGLPWRWLIKSVMPISLALLAVSMLSRLYREAVLLLRSYGLLAADDTPSVEGGH